MKKCHEAKQLIITATVAGCLAGAVTNAEATAFQLWEQDGASVGDYHAGRAASADDASTAFYNPAGLIRIHNPEFVLGVVPIDTNFKITGTEEVNNLNPGEPEPFTAQGGDWSFLPNLHFAGPATENLTLGLSIVAPFGLKTDYGYDTYLRYAATLSSLQVIDVAPAIGFAVNDHLSFGVGLDIEKARAEFDLVAGAIDPVEDTTAKNYGTSTALGYHLGMLYQFNPLSRIGLSYQSKVTHHFGNGSSTFTGPIANNFGGSDEIESDNLYTTTTLPATTTLSLFHTLNPRCDFLSSLTYTQWNVFKDIALYNVAGINENSHESDSITVIVPQNYHNTWNVSIGTHYHVNEKFFVRSGVGYDQSPSNDTDRNPQLPDSDRIAVALGGHYQYSKKLAFDVGWTHLFIVGTHINNNVQTVGDQITTTNGTVSASANVYGVQMKWDIV